MFASAGYVFGVAVGIVIAAILCVIFFKFANKDGKVKTQYDERQEAVRGRAYKYAFYAMLICEGVMIVLEMACAMAEKALPVEGYLLHFIAVIVGALVLACYSVFKDVYWGLNNNRKRYAVIFLAIAALNVIPVAGQLLKGEPVGTAMVNVLVLIMLGVLGIALLIKEGMDKHAANADEE